jgi:hypothetical protein
VGGLERDDKRSRQQLLGFVEAALALTRSQRPALRDFRWQSPMTVTLS